MKRTFRLLLVIALILVLIPHASAETYNGSCGAGIIWTLDTQTGVLHITGEGEMKDFLIGGSNMPPWYWQRKDITSVLIDPGLTRIGNSAFQSCSNLSKVSIPDTVEQIGSTAFAFCPALEEIELPCNLTQIDFGAFQGTAIHRINIPAGVTNIPQHTFRDCSNLTEINMPEGLLSVGDLVFVGCNALTHITFPDSVTIIGSGAFENCDALVHVDLPSSLKTIDEFAFHDCDNLYYIVLPEGLETIGNYAFRQCRSLEKVKLPSTLQHIGQYAFLSTPIKHLIIPESVISVGDGIVDGCTSLEKIAYLNPQCIIGNSTALGIAGKTIVYVHKDSTAEAASVKYNFAYLYITKDNLWEDEHPSPIIFNPFTDVVADSFYEDSVLWAVDNNITKGRTETTFAPNDPCKRSEVVTFLHRSQGKPTPNSVQSKFTDVKIGKFYTDAVAWAVEKSVTQGMGDGTFGVDRECTRAQVVTFLWRTAGCPEPTSAEHPFTDLNPKGFYYKAVLWAVENGITSGMTATTFGVDNICTRAQIVTFLHRFAG